MKTDYKNSYTTKFVGDVTNGSLIHFNGHQIEITGIWQDRQAILPDLDGLMLFKEDIPLIFLEGDALNGSMYNATLYVHKEADYNNNAAI